MCSLQPAGDLLGRPIQSELARHGLSQPRTVCQLTTLRTARSDPGLFISQRRSVLIIAAVPADFAAHCRGRVTQRPGHRSSRSPRRNASGYLLAFRQRQCQPRAAPGRRTNPSVGCHLEINRRRRLTKRPSNRFQRLTPLPAIPQLRLLCRGETSTISSAYHHTLHLFPLR